MRLHFRHYGKPAVTGLLLSLVLFLNAMAASPALHKWFHQDADQPSHECAVTMFAHGKVDSATVETPVVVSLVWVKPEPPVAISAFCAVVDTFPPGRAPPAFITAS